MEEENEKLEAKINGLKQEYEKIGLQVKQQSSWGVCHGIKLKKHFLLKY